MTLSKMMIERRKRSLVLNQRQELQVVCGY